MKIKSKITHLNVDEIASKTGNTINLLELLGKELDNSLPHKKRN